jgi:mannosyl-oligosaccharide alpha-1,2-mannosidase
MLEKDMISLKARSQFSPPMQLLSTKSSRNRWIDNNGLATIGSLVLEWTHLADLTGNQTYAHLS